MSKAVIIKVTGKVQGVFYRLSALEKAKELEISGFARNEKDGSVYIEAEGDENLLHDFIAWCQRGPSAAKVEKTDVSDTLLKNYSGFEIRY